MFYFTTAKPSVLLARLLMNTIKKFPHQRLGLRPYFYVIIENERRLQETSERRKLLGYNIFIEIIMENATVCFIYNVIFNYALK